SPRTFRKRRSVRGQADRDGTRPLGSDGNGCEHAGQSSSVQNHFRTTERTPPKLRACPRRSNHRRCCRDSPETIFDRRESLNCYPSRVGYFWSCHVGRGWLLLPAITLRRKSCPRL